MFGRIAIVAHSYQTESGFTGFSLGCQCRGDSAGVCGCVCSYGRSIMDGTSNSRAIASRLAICCSRAVSTLSTLTVNAEQLVGLVIFTWLQGVATTSDNTTTITVPTTTTFITFTTTNTTTTFVIFTTITTITTTTTTTTYISSGSSSSSSSSSSSIFTTADVSETAVPEKRRNSLEKKQTDEVEVELVHT